MLRRDSARRGGAAAAVPAHPLRASDDTLDDRVLLGISAADVAETVARVPLQARGSAQTRGPHHMHVISLQFRSACYVIPLEMKLVPRQGRDCPGGPTVVATRYHGLCTVRYARRC